MDTETAARDPFWEVIEKLPIGIFVSRAGKVVYANPTFAHYLGYDSGADLIGFGPEQILVPEEHPTARANVVAADGPFRSVPRREWRARRRDGSILTVSTEPTQQVEFAGQRAVLWTVLDVTELRDMQAKLLQSDRLASLGVLAAGVAHEINNPLTYVLSAVEFLRDRLPELASPVDGATLTALQQAVEEAVHGAERVRAIVRDLKTFSRVDYSPQRLDVTKIIESSLQMAMNEIRPRAQLRRSFAPCPIVLASEAALGQVFLNLIINATQAIPDGDAGVHQILVSTSTGPNGEAIIEVSDTGCGIAPEMQDRVFDPFVTTKAIGVGTGLGLSICRNTVRSLGGTITLESEVNLGTTVRVTLPPAPPSSTAPPKPDMRARALQPTVRRRLLVVDDEPAIVATVERLFQQNHDVVAITDAREACRRIAAGERFDLVITDLIMPSMTGMELHAAIAAIDPEQANRTLLLTGGAFTPAAIAFLDRVNLPRMAKPFNSLDLIDQVSELLRATSQAT